MNFSNIINYYLFIIITYNYISTIEATAQIPDG